MVFYFDWYKEPKKKSYKETYYKTNWCASYINLWVTYITTLRRKKLSLLQPCLFCLAELKFLRSTKWWRLKYLFNNYLQKFIQYKIKSISLLITCFDQESSCNIKQLVLINLATTLFWFRKKNINHAQLKKESLNSCYILVFTFLYVIIW